jgi:hypothetical protein
MRFEPCALCLVLGALLALVSNRRDSEMFDTLFGAVSLVIPTRVGRVVRVASNYPQRFVILSDGWLKVAVHWHRGRSVPCLGNDCVCCVSTDPRLLGYAAAKEGKAGVFSDPVVLEVPWWTVANLNPIADGSDGENWAGAVIELKRDGRGERRPLLGSVLGRVRTAIETFSETSVADTLCLVWGLPKVSSFDTREDWLESVRRRIDSDSYYPCKT